MAKWIPTGDVLITMVGDYPTAECSKCHTPCVDLGNFYPYCGEKMEKISDEEYKSWGYKG